MNAQDLVSERLGSVAPKHGLKKPSDFINEINAETKRNYLTRSSSKEEESLQNASTSSTKEYQKQRSVSVPHSSNSVHQMKVTNKSVQKQSADSLESSMFKKEEGKEASECLMEIHKAVPVRVEPPQSVSQKKSCAHSANHQTVISQGSGSTINQSTESVEADMKASYDRIKAESEKLSSLKMDDLKAAVEDSVKELNKQFMAPDTTAFPCDAPTLHSAQMSREFQKRSFFETSYEKVTRTGTPYENVESAWRREFVVAIPSGFYDNDTEEVFKQESRTEGFREVREERTSQAKDVIDQSYTEIIKTEGLQPVYHFQTSHIRQSNQIQQNSNGSSGLSPAYGAPPPPPPPTSGYGGPPTPPTSGYGGPPPPPPPSSGYGGPPPPPPPTPGNLPAVRIASEIGPKKSYEPPAAIQNAMMTKDKKPFTYTPGGLNLNEIRSPRMARRISRNAHTEDSCSPAQSQTQSLPVGSLPPAVIAAMQPQIAIPVFPPGGVPTSPAGCAPPPPPPPPVGCAPPPPPPPPATGSVPAIPVSSVAAAPVNRPQNHSPRPEFLSDIASHPPLRPVGQPPRSSFEPPQLPPLQVQLKPVSPKPTPESSSPSLQQLPFVPRSPVAEQLNKNLSPSPQIQGPPTPVNSSQVLRAAPPSPPVQQMKGSTTPPVRAPVTPPVNNQKQAITPPIRPPSTPPTPSLNKSPAPWLTCKPAQRESPPPWTMRQQSVEMQPPTPPTPQPGQQPHQPVTRVIPIMVEESEPKAAPATPDQCYGKAPLPQQYVATPPTVPPQYSYSQQLPNNQHQQHCYVHPPPNMQNYMQQLPQQPAIQPQYVQQQNYGQPEQQPRTRIIPIQMEGANGSNQQHNYQSQNSYPGNNQMRSQNGDAVDNRKFQSQTSYSGNPTQSRSFRVLQKITGSDEDSQKRLDESEY